MTEKQGNKLVDKLGSPLVSSTQTERSAERDQEDNDFVPIIKRNDEGIRHPDDILEKAIVEGMEQIQRPFLSLALSSVAALILSSSISLAMLGNLIGGSFFVAFLNYGHIRKTQ